MLLVIYFDQCIIRGGLVDFCGPVKVQEFIRYCEGAIDVGSVGMDVLTGVKEEKGL